MTNNSCVTLRVHLKKSILSYLLFALKKITATALAQRLKIRDYVRARIQSQSRVDGSSGIEPATSCGID
jgi:hypothetical protein